jgi:hypothetical protein
MKTLIALSTILIAGCAANMTNRDSSNWIEPAQAVQMAAAAPESGTRGTFVLTVKSSGTGEAGRLFLDSESDYRDQRNLAIAVEPTALKELEAQLHGSPGQALKGKQILVTGTARRTKIDFVVDGKPTDKYYYQTHVAVSDAAQIRIRNTN